MQLHIVDAPLGAGPESILPARLALGPFARSKGNSAPPLFFANAASRTRDGGYGFRARSRSLSSGRPEAGPVGSRPGM